MVQLKEENTMAFLGLFKKKEKKLEDSSTPKLEPISKAEESIELPKPPQLPKSVVIPSEIPPIKAPEPPGLPNPPKFSPIKSPEFLQSSKPIPPISLPKLEEDPIFSSKIHHPLLTPEEPSKIKSTEIPALMKKDVIKPIKKEKEDLPKFTDVIHKEGGGEHEVKIPSPPHYLASMGASREAALEGGMIPKSIRKPIFVEVNDYRKVMEEVQSIKKDTKKSKELVRSLDDFRIKNLTKIKKWERGLEKVQRDLVFTDKILFEEAG